MLKSRKKPRAHVPPAESRQAEVLTVGWMITVLTTFACELASLAAAIVHLWRPDFQAAAVLSGLLLFAALVVGLVGLALLPVVLKLRRRPPPTGITLFAILVQAAPLVIALLRQLLA